MMYSLRLEQSIAAIAATCSVHAAATSPAAALPQPAQPAAGHAARLL